MHNGRVFQRIFHNIYLSYPEYDRLKLLFIRGKSGTTFPFTAYGNAAQFKNEASLAWTRLISPFLSVATKYAILPRHPSVTDTEYELLLNLIASLDLISPAGITYKAFFKIFFSKCL